MFVVFYTVKTAYICAIMNCSTYYYLRDALMNPLNVWCMYSTVSYGYLLVFYIAKGIKYHDIYLIQCPLIRLYVVLNRERVLHVCVIRSIALFETSASERNVLPVPHVHTHTHTHSCLLFRLPERLVYNIPACCNMTQNLIPGRLRSVQWAAW